MDLTKFDVVKKVAVSLATTHGETTNAIESIGEQVFSGAELAHADEGVLEAFASLSDGTAFTSGDYDDLGGILGAFGYELYVEGNVGLVVDRGDPSRPVFRFIEPDFQNKALHGKKYETADPKYTLVSVRRGATLPDGYGEPFLMSALPLFVKQIANQREDMMELQGIANGSVRDMRRHHQLFAEYQLLDEQVLEAAGFMRVKGDLPHVKAGLARKLALETVTLFKSHVMEPIRAAAGVAALPQIVLPRVNLTV